FCYGGMEYPALCYVSRELSEKNRNYVIVHETAHQWWYAAVGSNQAEEAWQDEGLAEYSSACFFDAHKRYGVEKSALLQAAEKEYHAYYSVYTRVFGGADTRMSRSLKDYVGDYEYRAIAYDKGLMLFCALENAVGKAKTEKALKNYFSACAYQTASPAHLVAAFEKAGVDVSGLVASFLEGKAIV
ncbi:MAG: M1 family aminopeptidase, partial [Candidatus Scatosoma sp.]